MLQRVEGSRGTGSACAHSLGGCGDACLSSHEFLTALSAPGRRTSLGRGFVRLLRSTSLV